MNSATKWGSWLAAEAGSLIADYLRHCGYKVIEAVSGDEALVLLQQQDLKIDLVFSDIEMPGSVDGFALSQWIKQNRPDLDIVLTGTAPKAAETASELCEAGPLPKPYEPEVALDRIRRLLAQRSQKRSRSG